MLMPEYGTEKQEAKEKINEEKEKEFKECAMHVG